MKKCELLNLNEKNRFAAFSEGSKEVVRGGAMKSGGLRVTDERTEKGDAKE